MKKYLFLLLFLLSQVSYGMYPTQCSRFNLPGWWMSGEAMVVWRTKRFYPPLASTAALPGGTILFGDEYLGDSPQLGGRFDAGFWITPCIGFGGGFFDLGEEKINFDLNGDAAGLPPFGQPFNSGEFNQVSGNGFTDGILNIGTTNHIWGYDLYGRYQILKSPRLRIDALGGYRFIGLDDDLVMFISRTSGGIEEIKQTFDATNHFYSGLVGFYAEARTCNWAVQAIGKVNIGNMSKKVKITGSGLTPETYVQDSNFGTHSRNEFEVIPEINAQLQLRIWSHFWLTAGYQYIFWPRVLLGGESVNQDLPDPQFIAREKSFCTQSFTTGIYILY